MKTVFRLFILIFTTATLTRSNPIDATPNVKFSELYFDGNNKWVMELYLPYAWTHASIDSVLIEISGKKAKLNITYGYLTDSTTCYVINSDSLSVPLSINPDGDKIIINTYSSYGNRFKSDSTSFGNFPGSIVAKALPGCSICKNTLRINRNFIDFLYISKKPSIGIRNNIDGLGQKLTGRIYDKDNKLVTKYSSYPYFEIHVPIVINPDSTYSTTIYPLVFAPDSIGINRLSVRQYDWNSWYRTQDIEFLYLTYNHPDTVLIRDIHLKSNDYVLTGVEKAEMPKNSELTLINYPNPFNSSTNFFVKLPDDIKDIQGDIRIYNSNGQLIRIIKAVSGSTSYWDGKDMNGNVMSSGIYYYQLNLNNDKLKSGSMILLK